jgi:hypothetical protein
MNDDDRTDRRMARLPERIKTVKAANAGLLRCSQCGMDVPALSDREGHKMDCSRPGVTVHLSTGQDGNIFMILGAVRTAMRRADLEPAEIEAFTGALMDASSYSEALQTVMKWVHVT